MKEYVLGKNVLDAVANGDLPVCPGDIVVLTALRTVVLIVNAQEQTSSRNQHHSPSCGQWLTFVASDESGAPFIEDGYLEWNGYNAVWKIERCRSERSPK